jgi:hypothetical protein
MSAPPLLAIAHLLIPARLIEHHTMLKYLRIAVTACSLTACVLLVALWVRSYGWTYIIKGGIYSLWLQEGHISLHASPYGLRQPWQQFSYETPESIREFYEHRSDWAYIVESNGWNITIPHWFLGLLAAALATVPWIRWSKRFSLRTLLIATTLVAVALALVVVLT